MTSEMRERWSGRGFTLVELMLVVLMGIILAGVALPGAISIDDQKLVGTLRILKSDLEFAQARAIATGVAHRLLFNTDTQTYRVEAPPGVLLEEPLSKIPWIRVLDGPGGSELVEIDFDGALAVVFDGSGTPDHGGFVTIDFREHTGKITVVPVTGEIKLVVD